MKKLSIIVFTILMTFTSCSNDDDTTQEEDTAKLSKMHAELVTLSGQETHTCTNPDEWAYTSIVTTCGGQFMLYSKKANTELFLKKVEQYNKSSQAYVEKWKVYCAFFSVLPAEPVGIGCVEGKARILYHQALH
ncbi:hypothetical protein ACFFLS_08230 [Flavobacterium procerum]|uniref:Lipoprotein n=1 Tax=Flavobacterium procerum TaxID=1455569 RepID=A0ABV6BSJ6_9FLAO